MSSNIMIPHVRSKHWLQIFPSTVLSAVAVFGVGCVCALFYPILEELLGEKITSDGAEQKILGFWSILMLSASVGMISWIFSRTLTHLDSNQPGNAHQSLLNLQSFRDESTGVRLSSSMALLNGFMAMLTVIWSLS